ncbi:hypothetical protein [Brachybacterium sp. YJGR34]|uniref:hypothetical protein n=1 Tax=Brachybacterium sp. YJGR34 TaxID=2059911 RepID=UPI000E0C5FCF|nr:hypothetical protein [Brachybacterium sp. YJGR34]
MTAGAPAPGPTSAGAHGIRRRLSEGPAADGSWRGHEAYIVACACGALIGARIEEVVDDEDATAARRLLAEQRHARHAAESGE